MTSPYLKRPTRSEREFRLERALKKLCETFPRELERADLVPAWKRDRHARAVKEGLEALNDV